MKENRRQEEKKLRKWLNIIGITLSLYIIFLMLYDILGEVIPDRFTDGIAGIDTIYVVLISFALSVGLIGIIGFIIYNGFKIKNKKLLHVSKMNSAKFIGFLTMIICIKLMLTSILSMLRFYIPNDIVTVNYLGNFYTSVNINRNILYFIVFVLIIPIINELIFRVLILNGSRRFGMKFAVILSSLTYAMIQPELLSVIPAFFIGLCLSYVYLRYNSLKTILLLSIFVNLFFYSIELIPPRFYWVITILVILVYLIFFIMVIKNRHTKIELGNETSELSKIEISLTSIFFLIFIGVFVLRMMISFIDREQLMILLSPYIETLIQTIKNINA